jgi:hypothetical protein
MKEIWIDPEKIEAIEIHDSGSVCVHLPGEDESGKPRKWKSSEDQHCDIAGLTQNLVALRGDELEQGE